MSDQFGFDDDDDTTETNGIKALRTEFKKLQKQLAEVQSERDALKGAQRQATVKSLVEAKGLNPKIAALIPADVQGEEAVGKWIDDWADVFGTPAAASGQPAGMSAEDVAAAQRIAAAGQGADNSVHGKVDSAITAIGKAETQEEINALLAQALAGLGPS